MDERFASVPALASALFAGFTFPSPAYAQDPSPAPPAAPPAVPPVSTEPPATAPSGGTVVAGGHALDTACEDGGCCPPTAAQKVFIGVGDVAILIITFFLFVGLMERRFINTDRSSQLGRHLGMSLSLFLTAIGVGALAYLVTGCWPPEFTLWVAFAGVVWVLHGLYTLIVVRGN